MAIASYLKARLARCHINVNIPLSNNESVENHQSSTKYMIVQTDEQHLTVPLTVINRIVILRFYGAAKCVYLGVK